jgi:hypothetical protein
VKAGDGFSLTAFQAVPAPRGGGREMYTHSVAKGNVMICYEFMPVQDGLATCGAKNQQDQLAGTNKEKTLRILDPFYA